MRGRPPVALKVKFEALVSPEPNTGCILWTGTPDRYGYGRITHGGKNLKAHRVAWELSRGKIPKALHVLHRCDVRHCVSVDHLFLGTNEENTQDRTQKGRSKTWHSAKTHCPRGHAYSGANLYTNPKGHRFCRACREFTRR